MTAHRRGRALFLVIGVAAAVSAPAAAETLNTLRNAVVYLRADTRAKRATTVTVEVSPAYSTAMCDDVVYWTDPRGRLLEARRLYKGTSNLVFALSFSDIDGDYRFEKPGAPYRYCTLTVDDSIVVMQEPTKGHWSRRTSNVYPPTKYYFCVSGPFTFGANGETDDPWGHPCQIDIYDNNGTLVETIDTFDADGDGSGRIATALDPAYRVFTSADVGRRSGLWSAQPTPNRRMGFWLDGAPNLFSLSDDPGRQFVPVLQPTETIDFTAGQPRGWAPVVGAFYTEQAQLHHWFEYFKLESLHVYEGVYWREPDNDNGDPDVTDPSRFNVSPMKERLKAIMVDASCGGHNGPGARAHSLRSSMVFQPSAGWISSYETMLDNYDDGIGGPHDDVREYRECIVECMRQGLDPGVAPHLSLAPTYLALQDEPNNRMPTHPQRFTAADWVIAQAEIAGALRSLPGAEAIRIMGPMTSMFWDGFSIHGYDTCGRDWSEAVYAFDATLADGICFDYWFQRDAYGRELSFVLNKADELFALYDPAENLVVMNQMNMSPGVSSSVYDVTTGTGSLWWAAQVCHAARANSDVVMHFFTTAHDELRKGLLNEAGVPNPWGYATRFIQASKQEWRLALADDGSTAEVDGLVTYDPEQRILNVLFVNKVARAANVHLELQALPHGFRNCLLDVRAYRLAANDAAPVADVPTSAASTTTLGVDVVLGPHELYSAFITADGPYAGLQPAWFADPALAEAQDVDSDGDGFAAEEVVKWGGVPTHYVHVDPLPAPEAFPPHGDVDVDGDVDFDDFALFAGCMVGPDGGVAPGCAYAELDGDADVDLADYAALLEAASGEQR